MKSFFFRPLPRIRQALDRRLMIAQKAFAHQQASAALSDASLQSGIQRLKGADTGSLSSKDTALLLGLIGEVCRRKAGLQPFVVQYLAAETLLHGEVAQMNTGEGKTLVAVIAACCKALEGHGVHIITVNEYLARRDYEEHQSVFAAAGFSSGLSLAGMELSEKQAAYQADITYSTATEAGFDYLRDSVAMQPEARVQRALYYAIIDEADSILLDEAVTPMVLSGGGEGKTEDYLVADTFAKYLKSQTFAHLDEDTDIDTLDADFVVDLRQKNAMLTVKGVAKAEQYYRIDNLFDAENLPIYHRILQAISAYGTLEKDKDYLVRDGKISIIDRNTGRIMEGRRYSLGLQQALEAREKIEIHQESRTIASITYQKFFSLYHGISGMTGTAWPARKEFTGTYMMPVRRIPPNRPCIRISGKDRYYDTKEKKLAAIAAITKKAFAAQRPVLIGTPNDLASDEVSSILQKEQLPHLVLSAKQNADEAALIARAGMPGSIIVSTNMAGRGTDIRLGNGQTDAAAHIRAQGGLLVLGAERQRSRRVDDQLAGRAGRQGDPGESIFFISPDDELPRLFHPQGGAALTPRKLSGYQRLAESLDAGMRKSELEADTVLQGHRQNVLKQRTRLLEAAAPDALLCRMVAAATEHLYALYPDAERNHAAFRIAFCRTFGKDALPPSDAADKPQPFSDAAISLYRKKSAAAPHAFSETARAIMLMTIDEGWSNFLDAFLPLKTGYRFMALGKFNPRSVLVRASGESIQTMNGYILLEGMRRVFHVSVSPPKE